MAKPGIPDDPTEIATWDDERLVDYWIEVLEHHFVQKPMSDAELLRLLPEPIRNAYSVWSLWADWGNGGLEQYFFNKGPECATVAVKSLHAMDFSDAANTIEQAIQVYSENVELFTGTTEFSKLYEPRIFANLNGRFETFEIEFCAKWPAYVRAHADAMVRS